VCIYRQPSLKEHTLHTHVAYLTGRGLEVPGLCVCVYLRDVSVCVYLTAANIASRAGSTSSNAPPPPPTHTDTDTQRHTDTDTEAHTHTEAHTPSL